MITAVAFLPHPPALVPEVAAAEASVTAALRDAVVAAVTEVTAGVDEVVVVGAGDPPGRMPDDAVASWRGFGVDLRLPAAPDGLVADDAVLLPLSLATGIWALSTAGVTLPRTSYAVGAAPVGIDPGRGRSALLVMGDGSARRTEKAPGYVDDRAVPFDDSVTAALASGDPEALLDIDATLGAQLLAAGVPAWHAAGMLLTGARWRAAVHLAEAPYGVSYVVATWALATA